MGDCLQSALGAGIDRRTLEAQGIEREATIHLGAAGQRVETFESKPQSQSRPEKTKFKRYRDTVPYPAIDAGRTRLERNAEIMYWNIFRTNELDPSNDNRSNTQPARKEERFMEHLSKEQLKDIAKGQTTEEIERLEVMQSLDTGVSKEQGAEQQSQGHEVDLEAIDDRLRAFREAQEEALENAKRELREQREAEREEEKSTRDLDIPKAGSRYGQALAQEYDMRDPYGSMARAAMAEYGAFSKQQQSLDMQIANETDPDTRRALEMRKEIETCEYIAITDRRIARMDETLAGRETDYVKQHRDRADGMDERTQALREEYRELRQQQHERYEEKDPEQMEQERIEQRQEAWEQQREKERDTPDHGIDRDI
jgi:hypothetical protein